MDLAQLQLRISSLYESRPYPPIGYISSLFQGIRWEERQTLNYRAVYGACWGTSDGAATRPRILVAGCGTFEPIVVALANPWAEIVAVDLSTRSLSLLKYQARFRGLSSRILCIPGDFQELPRSLGLFDYVIATGVIHHLPDPLAGLKSLVARTGDRGVFRCMVYSRWGRSLLYAAKELASLLGIHKPQEFRELMASLPADHPYRIFFHLYSDARTDGGLMDGFLHPCDHAFTAEELGNLLEEAGLEASAFLHGPEGQPKHACEISNISESRGCWEKLALLEAFGELEENFRFVARKRGMELPRPTKARYVWNEALPSRGPLFSKILAREVSFDTSVPPSLLPASRVDELRRAFFLVPDSSEGTR